MRISWKQVLPWLGRGLMLWAMLRMPTVPQPLIVIGEPQTVTTLRPNVCVHTRLTDEVEEWKIQRTLMMVREMGAPWIVEYFPWAYYEGARGDFDFSHADMVVDHAEAQGLTVIARLGLVPAWARPKPGVQETTDTYLDEDHYDDFANYVSKFVERYRGRINHIIIWNEPNLSLEWGYRQVDPAGYVAMLKLAYEAAKAADPEVQVLAGALAPTLEPEGSPWGMNDLLYLQRMYDAGFAEAYDILSVHAYGLGYPPDEPPAPDLLNFRRVELVREIMAKNSDGGKPIMITESGWNDSPRWSRAVRPGARIDYTIGAYAWAEENWPGVQTVCTWAFRFPAPLYTYGDYYAFVTPDFTPRAIYEAVREWTGNEK
ncbi:MAG: endo-1,4-beta-xylanase [Chloroflexi bacterium]|nr:endo-1,4-beta-xylanase [Chloroflexota bacterium]